MINSAQRVNASGGVATLPEDLKSVSQHRTNHQSAAMRAALLVVRQYSRESKSQFSQECLSHLKASLTKSQDASA